LRRDGSHPKAHHEQGSGHSKINQQDTSPATHGTLAAAVVAAAPA
jgi:hypothetical protein